MMGYCESIQPTTPDDAMIFITCDNGQAVSIQADDRVDLVSLTLDEAATVKLIGALQAALAELRQVRGKVQP